METCQDLLDRWGIRRLSEAQERIISAVLSSQTLWQAVILPTGAGKSLCFQAPAPLFPYPTLVIYPLRSLMADQARRAREWGLKTVVLQGGQTRAQRDDVWRQIDSRPDLIITNPESLGQSRTLERLAGTRLSHVVIDEAHCTELWGTSFRPSYRELGRVLSVLNPPRVSAFTATATERVVNDWTVNLFGSRPFTLFRASADRPALDFSLEPYFSLRVSLPRVLLRERRPAVIFCRSRDKVRHWAHWIHRQTPFDVRFYHAGLSRTEKHAVESWFFSSSDGVLVATNAYGLGVDKPNIRTVVHLEEPPSPEDYLQEAGRAGRDGQAARAILLVPERFPRRRQSCRRKSLLTSFGEPDVPCAGCSSCRGDDVAPPEDWGAVASILERGVRRWTRDEARRALSGRQPPSVWDDVRLGGPGAAPWQSYDDLTVAELWSGLERSGAISFYGFGWWKGLLRPLTQVHAD